MYVDTAPRWQTLIAQLDVKQHQLPMNECILFSNILLMLFSNIKSGLALKNI